MTRAHINIVLPNGKVLHWYHNGDQYPDGIREWYGLDILLHNLNESAAYPEFSGELTDENVEKYIRAYHNFAYNKLLNNKALYKTNTPTGIGEEDYSYIIDLMNKQVSVYNWEKMIFQTKGHADNGDYLMDAYAFLQDYYQNDSDREIIDLALDGAKLARTHENRHAIINKIRQLDISNLRVTARTAADFVHKEQIRQAQEAAKKQPVKA